VVADPDFDLRADGAPSSAERSVGPAGQLRASGIRFDRLEDTAVEADLVRRHLDAVSLTGADALERRVVACRSPRVLHIATHGFFLADTLLRPHTVAGAGEATGGASSLGNPLLRSGLALAGANAWLDGSRPPEEADDGLLTAEDVSGMDLVGTELVVLSACDTGLGEYRSGEGLFGLRRAFAIAGADVLVMSLWQVPSEQTTALMEVFYDRLAAGSSAAEALREAKAAVRAQWSETFFWGAFVAFGATTRSPRVHSSERIPLWT
jgi:CHAT domain-containing protein